MQQKISFRLLPSEASNEDGIKKMISQSCGQKLSSITGYTILKKSIDARGKTIWVNLTVNACIDEPFQKREIHC